MTNLRRRARFIAEIEVCSRRELLRSSAIVSFDVSPDLAKKITLDKALSLRRANEKFVSVRPMLGLYYKGEILYSPMQRRPKNETRRHELFHKRVSNHGLATEKQAATVEESAAYAWEIATARSMSKESEAARYSYLAIRSVRFLHALGFPKPNGLLKRSASEIAGRAEGVLYGDPIALAFSHAKDFALYLECLGVIWQWGARDGSRIIFESIEIAHRNGFNEAREFLFNSLSARERVALESAYGIDPRKLRLQPFHYQRMRDDVLLLKKEHGRYVLKPL